MAALSEITICNMALGHLGRTVSGIQSFTERSKEAQICATWYDQCRQEVLESLDWTFARQRRALALHSDAPPDQWAYRYQVPDNMLALRRIWNPFGDYAPSPRDYFDFSDYGFNGTDATAYDIELSLDGNSETILTNLDGAIGIYTANITNVSLFKPLFVNALSHHLASKIALGVGTNINYEQKEMKAFQSALMAATTSDANQGAASPIRDAYTIRARN